MELPPNFIIERGCILHSTIFETEYKGMLQDQHIAKIMALVRESKLLSKKDKETYFK